MGQIWAPPLGAWPGVSLGNLWTWGPWALVRGVGGPGSAWELTWTGPHGPSRRVAGLWTEGWEVGGRVRVKSCLLKGPCHHPPKCAPLPQLLHSRHRSTSREPLAVRTLAGLCSWWAPR